MTIKLSFKEYDAALRENRLMGLKCGRCQETLCPPRGACAHCGSTDLEPVELSGRGKIASFTTLFVAAEGRDQELPYALALVALEEGPHLIGRIDTACPDKLDMSVIGKNVTTAHAVFGGDKYSAGDAAYPLFKLAD
ncbi:Zn-ribbon domain-containing OB-fold protein [Dehalogenimonas sp. THU2]|uniref:Zn-ribbon domain-containing OB-fold protein n=1 Tax=Dehalogenimonas sp. THU2 TaxID=3151121 RepID=UPI0032183490